MTACKCTWQSCKNVKRNPTIRKHMRPMCDGWHAYIRREICPAKRVRTLFVTPSICDCVCACDECFLRPGKTTVRWRLLHAKRPGPKIVSFLQYPFRMLPHNLWNANISIGAGPLVQHTRMQRRLKLPSWAKKLYLRLFMSKKLFRHFRLRQSCWSCPNGVSKTLQGI